MKRTEDDPTIEQCAAVVDFAVKNGLTKIPIDEVIDLMYQRQLAVANVQARKAAR